MPAMLSQPSQPIQCLPTPIVTVTVAAMSSACQWPPVGLVVQAGGQRSSEDLGASQAEQGLFN